MIYVFHTPPPKKNKHKEKICYAEKLLPCKIRDRTNIDSKKKGDEQNK